MDDRIMTDPRQRARWYFWLRDVASLLARALFVDAIGVALARRRERIEPWR